jgi:outer membrane lipoprotein-sorting protein
MTERNERPELDVLDQAVAGLRNVHVPDGPTAQLRASTVEALHALTSPPDTIRLPTRRKLMFRIIRYGAVAAAVVLIALAGVLALIDRHASRGFAQVVDNVNKAKSVSFVVKQKIGDQPELESRVFIQGDMFRYEIFGPPPLEGALLIMIVDGSQRKGLQLDTHRKIATRLDLEGRVPAEQLQEPIEHLRNLKKDSKDNVVQLGTEDLDGRKCQVYQVKGVTKAFMVPDEFKLWVDAKTGWPVKIHAEDAKARLSLTYDQFKWDEPLKDELFSLKVPKGYRLEELTPAVISPGRIYYHEGTVELRSLQPDGQKPETQFVPREVDSPRMYCSDRAELSPDGRYLAIAYTRTTNKGGFPPDRVLLWDRTHPKDTAIEAYVRPEGELQFWQFSADGKKLFVSFWEALAGKTEGHYSAEVVDLESKAKHAIKLPVYKDKDGNEAEMRFAAAAPNNQTYLAVGDGLHLVAADGKWLRRLAAPADHVIVASVRVSPDGKQAVYATVAADRRQQLFVVPLAGGKATNLLPDEKLTDIRARWSPDSNRIAMTCRLFDPAEGRLGYGTEAYLKIVDPTGSRPLTLLTKRVHPRETSLELTAWR